MTSELVIVNKEEELVRLDPRSVIPSVVSQAGPKAEEKFLEFFAASIRNMNTRMAYFRAVKKFFAWVEGGGGSVWSTSARCTSPPTLRCSR